MDIGTPLRELGEINAQPLIDKIRYFLSMKRVGMKTYSVKKRLMFIKRRVHWL